MWSEVLTGVITAAIVGIGGYAFGRRTSVRRAVLRKDPILIHIEQDPGIIYGNMPAWIAFPYFIPRQSSDVPPPPSGQGIGPLTAWWRWSMELGGYPSGYVDLQVTLTAWDDLTVLIDRFRVTAISVENPESGTTVLRPTGGADISLRQLEVKLNTCVSRVTPRAAGSGEEVPTFAFQLKAGETERFLLHIRAGDDAECYEWSGFLDLLVNNERKTVEIDDSGKKFKIRKMTTFCDWRDEAWQTHS